MTDTQTAPKTAKSLKPCTCRAFQAVEWADTAEGEQPETTVEETTECDRMTKLTFAQGHDAKLVSALVSWELRGLEIRSGEGVVTTHAGAVGAARSVSPALATKAANMLAKAKEKTEARAKREADKTTKKTNKAAAKASTTEQPTEAEPEPTTAPRETRGKVGRWTYEGTELNGEFTHAQKFGGTRTVAAGKWTEVA